MIVIYWLRASYLQKCNNMTYLPRVPLDASSDLPCQMFGFPSVMPRVPGHGTEKALHVVPDYFDSLQALRAYFESPRHGDHHAPRPIALVQSDDDRPRTKLLVCHDYKVSCICS